jgi:hypothetical protein
LKARAVIQRGWCGLESNFDKKKKVSKRKKKALLLGVGLDSKDEHLRITKGPNFRLVGGSRDTHEQMQETAIKVNEELTRRKKRLEEIGPSEFLDIIHKVK